MDNLVNANTQAQKMGIELISTSDSTDKSMKAGFTQKAIATNLIIEESGPYRFCGRARLNGIHTVESCKPIVRRYWYSVSRLLLRKLGYWPSQDKYLRDRALVTGFLLMDEDDKRVFIHFVFNLSKKSGPRRQSVKLRDFRDACKESMCVLSSANPISCIDKHSLQVWQVTAAKPGTIPISSDNPEIFRIIGRRLQRLWR